MKFKAFVPDHGETITEAVDVESPALDLDPSDFASAAEDAGAHFYRHCDGWEWSWPVIIAVVINGVENRLNVELSFTPYFHVNNGEPQCQ